jgi:Fic family protein
MSFTIPRPPNFNAKRERELEQIAQIDGLLQALKMDPGLAHVLEEKARLREAIASIGVEGTVVSEKQARAITQGTATDVTDKQRREFEGYHESLTFIKSHIDERFSLGLLLRIHETIANGDAKALPGKFRVDQRCVKRNGKVVYTPPPVSQLQFLVRQFIGWFNTVSEDKNVSPIIAAAICHFWFVWIHPFTDGNGRTARLLTTYLLLRKKSEGIKYFALSDFYNRHIEDYYNALEAANPCNVQVPAMNYTADLSPWILFFVHSYREQMSAIKGIANGIMQYKMRIERLRGEGRISEGHMKVLTFLSSREKASYDEIATHLGNVSKARVSQVLDVLREAKLVVEERIGRRMWFALAAPETEPDETILKKKLKTGFSKRASNKPMNQAALPLFGD